MKINELEPSNLKELLLEEICLEIENLNAENSYHSKLPQSIQLIKKEEEYNNLLVYEHPIDWLLAGYIGVHAFLIGKAINTKKNIKNLSEQNYYPPVVTQNLATQGAEYVYSQIAVVLVEEEIDESISSWLDGWKDDPRYFRKVIVPISINSELKEIANYIIGRVFYPWNSIKSYSDSKDDKLEIFDLEEVEEDE